MMSAISTALMPWRRTIILLSSIFIAVSSISTYNFAHCDSRKALAYAANFGAIGTLCVRWAPLAEVSIFISVLTSFTPVSAVVTNPLSGWLCSTKMGWPGAYYSHAAFCFIVFIFWALYQEDPQNHPSISEKELAKIHKDKTRAHIERDSFVPYRQLLSNKVIWILWFNAFVEMVGVTLVLTYAPSSLKSTECGSSMAVGLAGVCTALIGIFPASWPAMGVAMFTAVITLMGLNTGGFYKQYAHVVLTIIQFMKCVALFVAPATVAIFVSKEDEWRWRYVFWLHGFFLVLANCMFYPIATDKPASFTKITTAGKGDEEAAKSYKMEM